MGKITPKLSQSLRRQIQVRQALGLSKNSRKAQGHRRAKLAELELNRRRRRLRAKKANWNSLCYELQDIILSKLSLKDLYSARLAGLGGNSLANTEHLRMVMHKRIRNLKGLWKMWVACVPRYGRRAERETFGPVQFSANVNMMSLLVGQGGLPSSISEMRQLTFLDISRFNQHGLSDQPPPLTYLPRDLACCQNLLQVRLNFHDFKQFPPVLLTLTKLRRLEMQYNDKLKALPDNIGDKFIYLRFLNIRGCREITSVPDSLLNRLDKAKPCRQGTPLLMGRTGCPNGYLQATITPEKYPNLAEALRSGRILEMGPWEV